MPYAINIYISNGILNRNFCILSVGKYTYFSTPSVKKKKKKSLLNQP